MKSYKGYPVGSPETDLERIGNWVAEEMAAAGINEETSVDYHPCEDQQEEWGLGKRVWENFTEGES